MTPRRGLASVAAPGCSPDTIATPGGPKVLLAGGGISFLLRCRLRLASRAGLTSSADRTGRTTVRPGPPEEHMPRIGPATIPALTVRRVPRRPGLSSLMRREVV